jgi:hypothetical protein
LKRRLRVPELHNVALWRGEQADGCAKELAPAWRSVPAGMRKLCVAMESALRC